MTYTSRIKNIISGLIALVLVFSLITVGVKYSFGAFEHGYTLTGRFEAAGQGLIDGSDVKIRGVNVGEVRSIRLADGAALVTMRIDGGQKVPTTAEAVIRPKTLFGEKFVDLVPGEGEETGPYYGPGDDIEKTLGGFELEQVLAEAYPILQAVDPEELATVVSTLADAASGEGESINRQIVNSEQIFNVQAAHDADTRQFLSDLALLSNELNVRSPDVIGTAQNLNVALPPLNARSGELTTILEQASRLSGDLADVLEANRSFLTKSVVEGGKTVQLLSDNQDQIVPLVMGLRQYIQSLSEIVRIPLADGTYAAAVKGVLAGDACVVFGCAAPPADAAAPAAPPAGGAAVVPPVVPPATDPLTGLPVDLGDLLDGAGSVPPSTGVDAISELVRGLWGG